MCLFNGLNKIWNDTLGRPNYTLDHYAGHGTIRLQIDFTGVDSDSSLALTNMLIVAHGGDRARYHSDYDKKTCLTDRNWIVR